MVTAKSPTKKLTCSKRPNFFMTRSPRNVASHCRVPSAAYADAIYSEAQVTEYLCLCELEHRSGGRVAGWVTKVRRCD